MFRLISFSEVSRALDCQASWDFAYGGQLAGSALVPKRSTPLLSAGRAWGRAVAALHLPGEDPVAALKASLDEDAEEQRALGVHDSEAHEEMLQRLLAMLHHYAASAELFPIAQPERELLVPVPSRSGRRPSNRYRLLCYLDGTREEDDGRVWLIEFKLRKSLTSVEQIALSRQIRWYAWAYWQATGERPIGVETVERWNEVPKPARILKSGKPSHARDQLTTLDSYLAACDEHHEEPEIGTVEALRHRRWQQRVPIIFRDSELEEAGREITAAARMIGQLDRGEMMPLRHANRFTCGGCAFREICASPDNDLVDALYERVAPKRERSEETRR